MVRNGPTQTIEEYLEAIYNLTTDGQPVFNAKLARRLGVSLPTVTATMKRMVRDDLVTVNKHREIALTENGLRLARTLIRRHRLAERLLTDVLKVEWHRAHEDACRLEHAISEELEPKLAAALGNPATCPHGNPIPGHGVPARDFDSFPLDTAPEGADVVVSRISEEGELDMDLLAYFQRHGVIPGAALKVTEIADFAGTLTVRISDRDIPLGLRAASRVWVRPAA